MTQGIWILGDQLSTTQAALKQCPSKSATPVILVESLTHIQARPYHRQKLVLVWSAMRHFARELRDSGWPVTYVEAAPDFATPLNQWIRDHGITQVQIMKPGDRPFV
ncbi:MAG: cryptochrome/photolyase family protein, partial [Microcoleaceae cyanobacterium]